MPRSTPPPQAEQLAPPRGSGAAVKVQLRFFAFGAMATFPTWFNYGRLLPLPGGGLLVPCSPEPGREPTGTRGLPGMVHPGRAATEPISHGCPTCNHSSHTWGRRPAGLRASRAPARTRKGFFLLLPSARAPGRGVPGSPRPAHLCIAAPRPQPRPPRAEQRRQASRVLPGPSRRSRGTTFRAGCSTGGCRKGPRHRAPPGGAATRGQSPAGPTAAAGSEHRGRKARSK